MVKETHAAETQAFADRLRHALEGAGIRPSPTVVANEFNLRYWGRSITPHTARNWLLGTAIPTQDKLRVLADWLQVAPDVLRYGEQGKITSATVPDDRNTALDIQDREMLRKYLALETGDRLVVRQVVQALALAALHRANR